ncbi:MAG: type IV pilus assembly protein PilM [Deltaproteobacteria bacterium]|nr:type IV pilus assembly protein PilM [Deltaproteobacteria bacterium]
MGKNCIGLDIGSSAIKIVQLRQSKRGHQLVNFGIQPVPPQSIVDGSVMNTGAIAEAISALTSQLKVRQKEVAVAVAGHSVIIKKISVPIMTRQELEEQIHWEAEHHIPFAKDDVEIDHQVLQRHQAQNQMEVLLVAAKKEVVSDYAAAVREAGLNPVVMDVAAFTLQNCYELNFGQTQETVALLNIGASISTLNILAGGQSAFTRDVTIGGHAFTEEIQKQLNVSYDEAEAYKCGGSGGDEVVPQEVEEILGHQAEVMAGEFQRSFDFYLATTADGRVDRVYLSGGTARVPALKRAIEGRARVPVEVLDPFHGVQVDEGAFDMGYVRANAPMAAVAVGLAMRSEGDNL